MQDSHKDKVKKLRQAGFYAKGIVYALIGTLTAMAALGLGGGIEDRSGIMNFLKGLPAGSVLVALIAVGLLAFGLWRFYEAIEDPNADGDEKRPGKRIIYIFSGLTYSAIAYSFAKPLFGNGGGSGGGDTKKAALAELLDKSWGVWVIAAIAVIMAIMAVYQFYRGYSGKYMAMVDEHPDNKQEYQLVKRSGKFGYMARGVIFGIFTFFLIKVIADHNADAYEGTKGAFQYLLSFDYGAILMGAVALGFIGYGIFCILVARHANLTSIG